MNILMANWTWYPSGGDWTYIKSICDLYESNGHQIIPFSLQNENNVPTPFSKYFVKRIDYKSLYKGINLKSLSELFPNSIYSFEAKTKLSLLLKDYHVDLAQLNNINNYLTPSIITVLKNRKIPIVWRILDYKLICPNNTFLRDDKICEACYKHKYYKCVFHRCKKNSFLASNLMAFESYFYYILPFYKKIDMFLFQSEFTRDIYVRFGFDVRRTQIIENPYDCSNLQAKFHGENYILYFGRISKEKGLLTLLNAMKLLPEIELKIVGDGPEYESYSKYVVKNSLSNVFFLGPKWSNDLEPIIRDCDFVIIPSEWYEPSPYVALQSFSFGKPVIASNLGGLNDLIKQNENGLLFKAGDKDNLAQSIKSLYQNKFLIHKMGQNARLLVERKYNPEKYYSDTITVFSKLLSKG